MSIIRRDARNHVEAILVAEAMDANNVNLVAIIPPRSTSDPKSRDALWIIVGQASDIDIDAVDSTISDLIGD